MNLLSLLTSLGTVVADAPSALTFIMTSVTAVESRTLSGTDKMTAVLNAAEAFLTQVDSELGKELQPVLVDIEAFVNEMVAIYNDVGIFLKAPTGPVVS